MNTQSAGREHQYTALYQATLEQAAQAGESMMGKVLAAARLSLRERAKQVRGLVERGQAELSLKLLDSHAVQLNGLYPAALTAAFKQTLPEGVAVTVALASLHFDQLELMDSDQVHESVVLARAQQSAMLAAEASLAELNTYICATLGLKAVQPERNPLRPEVFIRALRSVLAQAPVPSPIQMDWLHYMSAALGKELSELYQTLSQRLQSKGVAATGYAVVRTHGGGGGLSAAAGPRSGSATSLPGDSLSVQNETILTLDKLRRLLTGELDQGPVNAGVKSFSAQFSREFESGDKTLPSATDFDATVPAALEALQEMDQVDRVMERIGQRRNLAGGGGVASDGSPQSVRAELRRGASGVGQALSLEVVALMVENIARDSRLLEPIRDVVKNLEPALLRLALVDPRFFSDKQHPARCLLQEITHRSLAYESVATRGFADFLNFLHLVAGPLPDMPIEDAQPFEKVLNELIHGWDARAPSAQLEKAVKALQHVEARNVLAEKIAREIQAQPDALKVPEGVRDFLCGPWAQVMAHARIEDKAQSEDPGQYRELSLALMWSAQPELTRRDIGKLTRLVPKLLGKLREGLELIDYPPVKTSAFFDLLMKQHQLAFRAPVKVESPAQPDGLSLSLLEDAEPWVAPAEAKASGFMDVAQAMSQVLPLSVANAALHEAHTPGEPEQLAVSIDSTSVEFSLPLGSWVEMLVKGAWVRTQLSWASPHGTLFLFTSAYGSTQSMTRRSRDKLLAAGSMRIVSGQPVVDGALDAVVQTAILNSMDVKT